MTTKYKSLILKNLQRRLDKVEKDFPNSEGGFKAGLISAIAVVKGTKDIS